MAYPSGAIAITGSIGTTSVLDTYPTHQDYLGYGGLRAVADITARNNITTLRRSFGMVVTTQDGSGTFILANVDMGGIDNSVANNSNWINFLPPNTGITSLNGLTAATQTFATGSTGTDFNISSATSTHTFNLPTASAVNRGALSSFDWTSFSGKGSVSSVGVSMPSAFNVASSPITTSGTIAITGAGVASQYIRGDGALANFPTSTGGGSSVSYYLNGSVNQGTIIGNVYKQMSKTAIFGAGTDFNIATNGYIAQFITDIGDPDTIEIPGGNWNFEFYLSASSNGGSPKYYIELYKYDGAIFTLIATNSATPENITGGTSIDLYFTSVGVPLTSLTIADRLAVRVYVINSGRTITLHTEDSHLCQIITTFSTGLTALNGLTDQVQYLATGVSGTDFNISSVGDTHTFNLPDASALNTGKLTSTDWAIFSAKGTITSVTATAPISSTGGTTPVISTSVTTNKLIGRASGGTGVMEEITLGTNLSFTGLTLNAAGGGGIAFTSVTYSTLQGLMGTSTLVQGNYYLINDFETIYDQPDYIAPLTPSPSPTTLTAATEPLIVQAATTFGLNSRAISTIYPIDVIEYDPYFTATEITGSAAKGRITYRIDTQNNKTNYDSRGVLFKRYETTAGSGIFSIYWDNGNPSTNFSTFDGDSYNNTLGNFYSLTAAVTVSPFILSNNVFTTISYNNQTGNNFFNNTFVGQCFENVFGNENTFNLSDYLISNNRIGDSFQKNIMVEVISNTIGNGCNTNIISDVFLNNIIGDDFGNNNIASTFTGNLIGCSFYGNTIQDQATNNIIGNYFNTNVIANTFQSNSIQNDFSNNNIGSSFTYNIIGNYFNTNVIANGFGYNSIQNDFTNNNIGSSFSYNKIQNNFSSNGIGNTFQSNSIQNSFSGNTTGISFYYNKIGNDFQNNVIGTSCSGNTIGNATDSNTIGDEFQNNFILDNFLSNVIGDQFFNNNIANNFEGNFNISNGFKKNNFQIATNSLDYVAATHVYNNYNCTVFLNATPTERLSYYDATDVLTITAPNS